MHVMIVTLGQMPDEPLSGRLADIGRGLAELLVKHSTENSVLYAAPSKELFIYGLRLNSEPSLVVRDFRALSRIQHYDKCLILELGTNHAETGMNVAMTWVTRRQSKQG